MFENLVNYDKSKTYFINTFSNDTFENLVNYDKSKTFFRLMKPEDEFENLVNYDKSKTVVGGFPWKGSLRTL